MHKFKRGDEVFPKWSQRLPSYHVAQAGPVMITIVDAGGNAERMHFADLVARDPATSYDSPRYEPLVA